LKSRKGIGKENENGNGKPGDLRREGTRGGELFADEIAGGNLRDTEEFREARGVGAFSDAGAAKENPLDRVVVMEERGRDFRSSTDGDGGGAWLRTASEIIFSLNAPTMKIHCGKR
jgi:hypothetical protein